MRAVLIGLILCLATACSADQKTAQESYMPAEVAQVKGSTGEPPSEKLICIFVWDAKLNKEVQRCRTMKLHKKHEGLEVPPPPKEPK